MTSNELPATFVPGFHDEETIRKMVYVPLGQTGLKVSQISIGTGGFSPLYSTYSEQECIDTLREAIKSGINYIDTAPWYGQGESEEILGKALKDIPRKAYYLATKVGRYEKDPKKMFDFSIDKTIWSVQNSLDKLGVDYIDIIQVHDIEFAPSLDVVINECLPTLDLMVQKGVCHYIGVTGYPVSILKECVEKSQTHIATILSYTRLTLIDETLKDYLLYFQMQGIGIINAAAPSMGLLTNSGPQPWHPAHEETKQICKQAADYCKQHNVELGRLATYYAFNQRGPDTNLVGMNNLNLLKSNLDVYFNGISEEEAKVMEEIKDVFFSKIQNKHWEGVEISNYREQLAQ